MLLARRTQEQTFSLLQYFLDTLSAKSELPLVIAFILVVLVFFTWDFVSEICEPKTGETG
jgi:hypothetical protein